ncbi:MAG TPA: cyanophycinase [Gemmatimonadaceae bacterium]|nr:cyanophycinase [Gemmatimonadaceae bacterium]
MRVLLALVLAASAACAPPSGRVSPAAPPAAGRATGQGTLFVVGGGPQPESLVRRFVELAGGPRARIVVMAMASAGGQRSGEEKAAQLRSMGAEARNLWFDKAVADEDSIVRAIGGATAIWLGGGDQSRLMAALRGSRSLAELQRVWRSNGVMVGGTSAGAAVLSTPMITGDERRPGGARRDTAQSFITIEGDNVVTADGMALLTDVIVDQHFVRRRRHNRLISLVIERPPHLGAGIDESTALLVHPDGTWSVEGVSVVVVYDARRAERRVTGQVLGAADVRMHVLTPGSTFDPRPGEARLR